MDTDSCRCFESIGAFVPKTAGVFLYKSMGTVPLFNRPSVSFLPVPKKATVDE